MLFCNMSISSILCFLGNDRITRPFQAQKGYDNNVMPRGASMSLLQVARILTNQFVYIEVVPNDLLEVCCKLL